MPVELYRGTGPSSCAALHNGQDLTGSARNVVAMDITAQQIETFLTDYASALLARDESRVAALYAVPALILFPDGPIAVTAREQTEQFFASAWGQYDGVDDVTHNVTVMGTGPATAWLDVTWLHSGEPRERFCYQLARGTDGAWRIAVLTPLAM